MTATRAFARRGLTSTLEYHEIAEGGEWEYLLRRALQVHGEGRPREVPTPYKSFELGQRHCRMDRPVSLCHSRNETQLSAYDRTERESKWDLNLELVSAVFHSIEELSPEVHDRRKCLEPIFDTNIPICLALNAHAKTSSDFDLAIRNLQIGEEIKRLLGDPILHPPRPWKAPLGNVIIEMTNFLHQTQEISWKDQGFPWTSFDGGRTHVVRWRFDVVTGALDDTGHRFQVPLQVELDYGASSMDQKSSEMLSTLLQLSVTNMMRRTGSVLGTASGLTENCIPNCIAIHIFGQGNINIGLIQDWRGPAEDSELKEGMPRSSGPLSRIGSGFQEHPWMILPVFGLFLSNVAKFE